MYGNDDRPSILGALLALGLLMIAAQTGRN
jgi:hypothetical protein